MRRAGLLIVALLAAGGCQRKPDAVPADAAAEAQAQTSAKALADIAAAEVAARTPLPASQRRELPVVREQDAAEPSEPAEDIGAAELSLNEAAAR